MKDNKESAKLSIIRMYNVSDHYQILDKVGRGTYGTVYKAKGLKDGRFYAIKKLENNDTKLQQEGFPITALREITLLKQIDHPNIIKLKEIIVSRPNKRNLFRGSTFLVFEYMDHDFAGLFKMKHKFQIPEIKCIVRQLLEGIAYLHRNKILHRDIKSANILLNDEGDVKLADFGLGRKIRYQTVFTYKVVTLWYRAPQLLLGSKTYTDKIDVWSLGCVVAQFFTGEVLFRKQTEFAQMDRIYQIVGDFQANDMKITDESYKIYQNLQDLRPKKSLNKQISSYLKRHCPNISQTSIDFIERLLHLDPNRRMSCQQALRHPFFSEKPLACPKADIQKMEFQCHQMFKDRSIKIQRIQKLDDLHDNKQYRHKDNRDGRQYREKDVKERSEKDFDERKYTKNYRDDRDFRNREGRTRDDRYHYQNRKNDKYFSSPQHSSFDNNSDSESSSSRSSVYSSKNGKHQGSSRSRSRYDERRHRNDDRRIRESHRSRQNYKGREYQQKRKVDIKDDRKYSDKIDRDRRIKDDREEKGYKNQKDDKNFKSFRDDRRKEERIQIKPYRDDRLMYRRDEKKDGKREEYRQERDKREIKKEDKRDQRKEDKRDERKDDRRDDHRDDRRDYHDRRDDWRRHNSKQRKYQKYQKNGMYDSRGGNGKYYDERDYKRKQQKWDQKNLKMEKDKYQQSQKHGEYTRRDDVSQKRTDKYYFVSGKNAYRKKEHRSSHSSERSSIHHYKKDRDYSRQKNYNHERNQRKNYYKKQYSDSNEHRNH